MTFVDNMTGAISAISYRIHLIVGFNIGVIASAITDNLDKVILTFVMGASSALGAGIIKLLVDWINHKFKTKAKQKIQEEMQEDIHGIIHDEIDKIKNESK